MLSDERCARGGCWPASSDGPHAQRESPCLGITFVMRRDEVHRPIRPQEWREAHADVTSPVLPPLLMEVATSYCREQRSIHFREVRDDSFVRFKETAFHWEACWLHPREKRARPTTLCAGAPRNSISQDEGAAARKAASAPDAPRALVSARARGEAPRS